MQTTPSVNTIQEKGSTGSKYGNEFRGKYWMKEVSHFPSVQFHSFLGDGGSAVILTRGISHKKKESEFMEDVSLVDTFKFNLSLS